MKDNKRVEDRALEQLCNARRSGALVAMLAREVRTMRNARQRFIMVADISSGVVPFGAIMLKADELYPPQNLGE